MRLRDRITIDDNRIIAVFHAALCWGEWSNKWTIKNEQNLESICGKKTACYWMGRRRLREDQWATRQPRSLIEAKLFGHVVRVSVFREPKNIMQKTTWTTEQDH